MHEVVFHVCTGPDPVEDDAHYVIYLDAYPGNLQLAELPDLTEDTPGEIDGASIIDITPANLADNVGMFDVSPDGTKIVFAAVTPAPVDSWDIYTADITI